MTACSTCGTAISQPDIWLSLLVAGIVLIATGIMMWWRRRNVLKKKTD